jgi:GTP-binding protein
MFVKPGDKVYAGQIVGEHNRPNDLTVNIVTRQEARQHPQRNKEATSRSSSPPRHAAGEGLEYIDEDELVEITPTAVRLRKRMLNESDRKKAARQAKDKVPAGA